MLEILSLVLFFFLTEMQQSARMAFAIDVKVHLAFKNDGYKIIFKKKTVLKLQHRSALWFYSRKISTLNLEN